MDHRHQRGAFVGLCLALTAFLSIGCVYVTSYDANAAKDYLQRFNIPENHIQLEWAKSGSGLKSTTYKGKIYKWLPSTRAAGVKAGYATMWDRSSRGYCTRSDAQTDSLKYFGQRLMAVGACPNYGKYIAFVDSSGNPVDSMERFTNEIHGSTMPFSTSGCSSTASPGNSEVPMASSGWVMYSGYLVKCPFNEAVYQNDMLQDTEYDSDVCSFVTLNNPLVFLDTSQREGSLAYKPYAFHGKGGHKGYDFIGSGVGCPPYSPPLTTRSMKSPDIASDPFLCSQLSRCTNLCWPWDANRPCYRSLPVSFNHNTQECLILGYHTQTYINNSCASKSTTDPNAKYCVKAHKTVESSMYTYLTAFTRPDYETACPPREPLKNVVFGTLSGGVCKPLSVTSSSTGTAGQCGEAVFAASSDDTPSGAGGSGSSSIYWSSWLPQSSGNSKGSCNLYSTVPNCLFAVDGAFSFTALSAADPSLAVVPSSQVIAPGPCSTNPCQNGGTCELPSGTCKCTACYSGKNCETKVSGCCASNADCSGHGTCSGNKCTCNSGYSGALCETGKCDNVACRNGGTCTMPAGTCTCPAGYSGSLCEITACDRVVCQNGGTCKMPEGKCTCKDCFLGDHCERENYRCCKTDNDCNTPNGSCVNNSCNCNASIPGDKCENKGCDGVTCANGGSCEQTTGKCSCPACYSGPNCEVHEANCCENDNDCNSPNGTCVKENCKCTADFPAPNCKNLCSAVHCKNDGTCDPTNGKCSCPPGWGGVDCTEPVPCGTGSEICSGNSKCDAKTTTCICKPGYTGEECRDLMPECKEICDVGGLVIREDAKECDVDCYSKCCALVLDSCNDNSSDSLVNCVRKALAEDADGNCCLADLEEGSYVALYIAGGILLLLLVAGAGGVMYYRATQEDKASGAGPDAPVDEAVCDKEPRTRDDSAISVNFEDYANTPDDDTDAMNTEDKPAQDAVWED